MALYILVKILHKFSVYITKLKIFVNLKRTESRQGNNSKIMIKIKELK